MTRTALRRRLQAGLSMIEILVSLTIVAFGLLGLLGLQARALSFQRDSFDRRSAAEMVAQLAEVVRSNHFGLTSGRYAVGGFFDAAMATPLLITPCAVPGACTINELADRDQIRWFAELRRRLPASAAYLQWNPLDPRAITVSVAWAEPQQTGGLPGADPLCLTINARLTVVIPNNYRCFETAIYP
ncbi:MAG: type IV pilus modification protein PilV [Phycisphaerae bacterium]|nr:type IV pilus modification protein PilV [Gemmatimonadaceae bacterium]